jgi:CRP/FNR family transcriptional regulator, cyclic AMP receptor protein
MPKDRIQALDQRCRWRTYEADEFVFEHQDSSRDVHFVTRGSVRVVLFGKSGQEVLFRTLQEGHHLGELAAIDGKPRSATIVAITRATIATMPQSVFLELLESDPKLALKVCRHLTAMVRSLTERVLEFSTLKVKHRIYAELLRLSAERSRSDNTAVISPPPAHAELASRISTHREAVTRELNELVRAGLLEKRRGALEIRDVRRLFAMLEEASTEG